MSQVIKQAYLTDRAMLDPVPNVATDPSLLAGYQSDEVTVAGDGNAVGEVIDYLLSGIIKLGFTPSGGPLEILVAGRSFTGNYAGGFGAAEGALTLTSRNPIDHAIQRAFVIECGSTPGGVYEFGPISVRSLFGGMLPRRFAVGVVHDTGDNLDNFGLSKIGIEPVYYDVA